MKTITQNMILFILAAVVVQGKAQSVSICNDSSTVITAINSASLTNPSYSLNPGGIISSNPSFTVSPTSSTTYTLYVTGLNSSSAMVTTTSTSNVTLMGTTFSLSSPNNFTLGCGSVSVTSISINNANTTPVAGGPVSYTVVPPGSPYVLYNGTLSFSSVYTINIPGTWTVVVRDNSNFCSTKSVITVSSNTTAPVIGPVSVSQSTLDCTSPTATAQITPVANMSYSWLFTGVPGVVAGNSISVLSNSVVPTATLIGIYTLAVTDNGNSCRSTTTLPFYQNLFPPTASIAIPGPPACSPTLVLTNTSSTGIPSNVFPTASPVVAALWEGPSPQVPASYITTYIAQTSGVYTLTAKDMNNGCIATATINVAIGPVAAFVHTISAGNATFSSISTGATASTSYFWDFGDGNTSTLQNPTHTYVNGGAHLVKLKLTDPVSFCSDSTILSVNISGVPCTANSNFSMVPTATTQVWNVVPAYPWNISAASWSWGDGSSSNTLYTAHQYSAAGMYNICLSVTVSCGDTSTTCTSYSVYRTAQAASMLQVNVVAPELVSGLKDNGVSDQLSWNIFPNPNSGEFNLDLKISGSQTSKLIITDLSGRIVHEQLILNPESTSIHPQLPPGIYLVTLEVNHNKYTKRMAVYQ